MSHFSTLVLVILAFSAQFSTQAVLKDLGQAEAVSDGASNPAAEPNPSPEEAAEAHNTTEIHSNSTDDVKPDPTETVPKRPSSEEPNDNSTEPAKPTELPEEPKNRTDGSNFTDFPAEPNNSTGDPNTSDPIPTEIPEERTNSTEDQSKSSETASPITEEPEALNATEVVATTTTKRPTHQCLEGWSRRPILFSDCYKVFRQKKTWRGAETKCQEDHSGHLASVHDQTENDFLLDLVKQGSSEEGQWVWLGLRNDYPLPGDRLRYKWSDERAMDYQNWLTGKPDALKSCRDVEAMEACGGFWTNATTAGEWDDRCCDDIYEKAVYICRKAA